MSDSYLQRLQALWPSLTESQRQYLYAIACACVDVEHGNMSSKDAQRFDHFLCGKYDVRNRGGMVRFLVSFGYLPEGFELNPRTGVEAEFAKHKAERAAERAKEETREREWQAQAPGALDAEKQMARKVYLRNGGTAQEFEAAWPAMRDEIIRQRG